ncbi:MAG: Rieske 2Fe-2S domain-containing protein [Candidatus Lustribacter sp.]|jgi:5,5'-dehydrodivanillate O-demethylase
MLTREENELLTHIGPGTRMGALLRRYWFPVAATSEMHERWTMRVRLLGEDLVLYRDRSGAFGLIAEFCPHRRASLAYGIPERDGIRCPYHGWKFDGTGTCLDQPNEPAGSAFKEKVATAAYPVRELGGMLWAYAGPLPAPEIPAIDGFVVDGAIRLVGKAVVPCNWLQIMENSVDPIHTEWAHGHLSEFVRNDGQRPSSRRHERIRFREFEYGIYKQRLLAGQPETADDWTVGHPVIFPNILAVGNASPTWRNFAFQIRVPMDDTNTLHLWYNAYIPPAGATAPPHLFERVWAYDVPYRDERGEYTLQYTDSQDIMNWITQGAIADRSLERLGTTDMGIIAYRQMLHRELEKVERGEDPMGVIRDPARNPIIELPLEKNKHHMSDGFEKTARRSRLRFAPIMEDLVAVFAQRPSTEGELVGAGR